tara:strand:+ start:3019 stop:3189 length:171 start_codon:yes stop_codon:yes gene_type:complete
MSYAIKYIYVGRWEKGGTEYKIEYMNTKEELLRRRQQLMENIRVGNKSISLYKTQK